VLSPSRSSFGQLIARLDRVSRVMNPVLFLVAIALVVLNLAFVANLIDWRLPPTPTEAKADGVTACAPPAQASAHQHPDAPAR
jgi:hypothetical protein